MWQTVLKRVVVGATFNTHGPLQLSIYSKSYTNVLGFLVADGDTFSDIVPNDNLLYIKAAVRDVKGYIRWNNYRDIPVGTTLAYKIDEYQLEDFEFYSAFMVCGSSDQSVDFWGLGAVGEFWCDSVVL
jgi:hypothetical protein